jgi:glycosyltransferase involved in cell wall biosynthesis
MIVFQRRTIARVLLRTPAIRVVERGHRRALLPIGENPLVSCIMPTRNRREHVPRAIGFFLTQTYRNRELIVVDDGYDDIRDLIPMDRRIRYIRCEHVEHVGAKRNFSCAQAGGCLIAHWDDDDWMAPSRLDAQVTALLETQADVCGIDRIYYLDLCSRRAWKYIYPRTARPWLAGGSLLYRKEFWRRNRFPDISVGEDAGFLWASEAWRMAILNDSRFYVAMIHGANTSPKKTQGHRWQSESVSNIAEILGPDRVLYGLAGEGEALRW